MMKEGSGWVKPKTVSLDLDRTVIRICQDVAEKRESYRNYSASNDIWKRGLAPNAVLIGIIGEFAFSQWLYQFCGVHCPVDSDNHKNGDPGFDFHPFEIRIQVKTRGQDSNLVLIRRQSHNRLHSIEWDYCVQQTCILHPVPLQLGQTLFDSEKQHAPPLLPTATVTINGFLSRERLTRLGAFTAAKRGTHENLELTDEILSPISDLQTILAQREIAIAEETKEAKESKEGGL